MKVYIFLLLIFPAIGLLGQELLWSEEFSGEELDPAVWNYELGDGCPRICGWGNNELQRYTTRNSTCYLTLR